MIASLVLLIIGVLVLFALAIKGDVKASFKFLGAGFSLEASDKKVKLSGERSRR